MKLLKFFQYAYLVIAVLFLYKGISEWTTDRNSAYISFFFAALAVFMFFFRQRFRKKFEDRNNQ
ncbi:hypothetical protein [Winogradskyella alexanderae]|uniref:Uncharacterized protein n=1 Tax=Winogradskyella alexanderae TaxID=2877123 RepID=A0ABS7XU01_9FLAO|nr:hypothetical protein [Winogradskyella alexanderae]MCA0132486.1 hypothetical protein [Winogradskyella alexanderae]